MASGSHRDDGRRIEDFVDRILVVCPRCGGRALVRPFDPADGKVRHPVPALSPRRLVCAACGLVRTHLAATAGFGRATDPYFDLPLVLQAPCAGHVVWAYNEDHLAHLLAYVEAGIRGRPVPTGRDVAMPASLLEKMPGWFGAATNRRAVSRALRALSGPRPLGVDQRNAAGQHQRHERGDEHRRKDPQP